MPHGARATGTPPVGLRWLASCLWPMGPGKSGGGQAGSARDARASFPVAARAVPLFSAGISVLGGRRRDGRATDARGATARWPRLVRRPVGGRPRAARERTRPGKRENPGRGAAPTTPLRRRPRQPPPPRSRWPRWPRARGWWGGGSVADGSTARPLCLGRHPPPPPVDDFAHVHRHRRVAPARTVRAVWIVLPGKARSDAGLVRPLARRPPPLLQDQPIDTSRLCDAIAIVRHARTIDSHAAARGASHPPRRGLAERTDQARGGKLGEHVHRRH